MPYGMNVPIMQAAVDALRKKFGGNAPSMEKPPANPPKPKEPPKRGGWDDLAYYDRMAEYMYYHKILQDELKKRNPVGVGVLEKDMKDKYNQEFMEHGVGTPYYSRQYAQQRGFDLRNKYKGELTEDDVKAILGQATPVGGQNPYERFRQLRDEAFKYDMGLFERSKPIEGFSLEEYFPMVSSSIEEEGRYYRPEIKDGQLVRRTNSLKQAKLK